jgi:hypothetical protein
VAGVGIYAGVTSHSTSVPFYRIAVGWLWMAQSRSSRKGAKMKDDLEDIPMMYLLYVVLGIFVLVAGAVFFTARMF